MGDFRREFHIPRDSQGQELCYLAGNSLGLQPKITRKLIEEELSVWEKKANQGHHEHDYGRPWITADEECVKLLLPLVGAEDGEVAVMGSLTANLHLLMCAFYQPTPVRYKIVVEAKAFPSDHVAMKYSHYH